MRAIVKDDRLSTGVQIRGNENWVMQRVDANVLEYRLLEICRDCDKIVRRELAPVYND